MGKLHDERAQHYTGMAANNFFWRTYDRQEIDWEEERSGGLFAYEMKWRRQTVRPPAYWLAAYPESMFSVVAPENYREFVGIGG